MTEEAENPEGIAGPPVGLVAVEDAGGLRSDAVPAAQGGKRLRLDVIADRVVLKIALPVDVDRTGEVPHIVEEDILVALDDADPVVLEMIGHPGGGDQDLGGERSCCRCRSRHATRPAGSGQTTTVQNPRLHETEKRVTEHAPSPVSSGRKILLFS